jgi:DNA-binding MarR family transcriptional regulator
MTIEPLRPASSVGYQVNRLARLFETALRHRIAVYGVVPGQFPALLALYEQDGQTQRELCAVADVDQSTMAKTLARMRRDGLIREEPDPGDARRVRYYLTPAARDLEAKLSAAGHDVIALATRGIPAARLEAFDRALNEMAGNLGADLTDDPAPQRERRPTPAAPRSPRTGSRRGR